MKKTLALVALLAWCAIALGCWWWISLQNTEPSLRGRTISSFHVPDHLDASEFDQRLKEVGFVAVDGADFESFLSREQRGSAVAPGNSAYDLKAMKAFQHIGNTDSMTRIIGYDADHRRVLYFRSQVAVRENGKVQQDVNVPDTIEEELRK